MIIPNIWENKKWQPNHQPGKWPSGQLASLSKSMLFPLGNDLEILGFSRKRLWSLSTKQWEKPARSGMQASHVPCNPNNMMFQGYFPRGMCLFVGSRTSLSLYGCHVGPRQIAAGHTWSVWGNNNIINIFPRRPNIDFSKFGQFQGKAPKRCYQVSS